jgi:peptidoglycan/LPS O-acetylase OafA/YrhL
LLGSLPLRELLSFELVVWLGSSILLLPNFDPGVWSHVGTGVINGPLYTIPAEVSFYLLVPLLVLTSRKFGFWKMMAVFLAVSLAGCCFYYYSEGILRSILHHTFLQRGACFAMGIHWAKYWGRIPVRWWAFVIALVFYVTIQVFGPGNDLYGALKPSLIAIPLSYVLVDMAT